MIADCRFLREHSKIKLVVVEVVVVVVEEEEEE